MANELSVKDRISKCKFNFLLRHPFLGELACRLVTKEDKTLPAVMATDGRSLYFNAEKILEEKIDDELLEEIIAHEVGHNLFSHTGKRGVERSRHKIEPVWRIACEFTVNHFVADMCCVQIGQNGTSRPSKIASGKYYYDKKYSDGNWTTENIYDDLMKSDKVKFCSIDADGNVTDQDGNVLGKINDDHSKWGKEKEGKGKGKDKKDGQGEGEGNDESDGSLDGDWKIWVAQAAQSAQRQGKLPAGIERMVGEFLESKINWRQMLAEFLLTRTKDDYSWRKLNKRNLNRGVFSPALYSETINVAFATDTSGSMTEGDLREAFSEVNAICNSFTSYKLHLIACDAAVHHYQEVMPGDEIDFKGLAKGGGGTSFIPTIEFFTGHDIKIDALIYFSDMYGTFPDDAPEYPTMWLTKTVGIEPPFGQKVMYED